MPASPAHQRSCRVRAPTPSGVTAPTPVMTTRVFTHAAHAISVDGVADGLECLGMSSPLISTPYSSCDDLAELDEVQRVDVERLEGRVGRDVVGLGAELLEGGEDAGLDLVLGDGCRAWVGSLVGQADSPPSTVRVVPVT